MEITKNNLRKAKTNLKNVQAKAKELRETHLRQSMEEAEADENFPLHTISVTSFL